MNPLWTQVVHDTIKRLSKKCPHCGKTATYLKKRTGQFYLCKSCGHKFKEKGKRLAG